MSRLLSIVVVSLALALPVQSHGHLRTSQPADEDDGQFEPDGPQQFAQQGPHTMSLASSSQVVSWHHHHKAAPSAAPPASPAAATNVKADAADAHEAAKVAKQAAVVANQVAEHSVKVTGHAKKALKHALGALHDARVESKGLADHQKESLKKAEGRLREATKTADFGKLKKIKDDRDLQKERMENDLHKRKSSKSEKEELLQEIQKLRKTLKEKSVTDKVINKGLDELTTEIEKSDGSSSDESKAELERLREQINKLEGPDDEDTKEPKVAKLEGMKELGEKSISKGDAVAAEVATPVEEKGIDIDTQMPYGDLEPFGREDTAQELTERSITESDQMVDQLERAEVAEEKRAVFRALTRLRGAAITSYDGVARSQTGNIDEYNKIHQWRKSHPLHHLADEESDVTKWAFPDNAD